MYKSKQLYSEEYPHNDENWNSVQEVPPSDYASDLKLNYDEANEDQFWYEECSEKEEHLTEREDWYDDRDSLPSQHESKYKPLPGFHAKGHQTVHANNHSSELRDSKYSEYDREENYPQRNEIWHNIQEPPPLEYISKSGSLLKNMLKTQKKTCPKVIIENGMKVASTIYVPWQMSTQKLKNT